MAQFVKRTRNVIIYQITKRVFASFISKNSFCYLRDIFIINFRYKFSIHLQNCSICSLFLFLYIVNAENLCYILSYLRLTYYIFSMVLI